MESTLNLRWPRRSRLRVMSIPFLVVVGVVLFLSHVGAEGTLIFHPKIVGGEEAPIGRYTYIVSIKLPETKRHMCAGALIHPRWVVTAASCFIHYRQDVGRGFVFPVQIGGHAREDEAAEARQAELYVSDGYDWSTFSIEDGIDLAMLRLDSASENLPAKLATNNTPVGIHTLMTVMGWGRQQRRGRYADRLNHAQNLQYIAPELCQYLHRRNVSRLICAGIGNAGPCAGDKGAPLVLHRDDGLDTVVGIGTFFSGIYYTELCSRSGRPAYFTDVRLKANMDWRTNLMGVV